MISVIGGLTIDHNVYGCDEFRKIGGPPYYISRVLSQLAIETNIFSAVGADFAEEHLIQLCSQGFTKCYIKRVKGNNILFKNIYSDEYTRTQYAYHTDYTIDLSEGDMEVILSGLYAVISPVFHEVDIDLIKTLRKHSDRIKIAVDPQGFVRDLGVGNKVLLRKVPIECFRGVDVLKLSVEELSALVDKDPALLSELLSEIRGFISVTMGRRGSAVISEGTLYFIPSYPVKKVIDPTGAGDVYLAGLVYGDILGLSAIESSVLASAVASAFLEGLPIADALIKARYCELSGKVVAHGDRYELIFHCI